MAEKKISKLTELGSQPDPNLVTIRRISPPSSNPRSGIRPLFLSLAVLLTIYIFFIDSPFLPNSRPSILSKSGLQPDSSSPFGPASPHLTWSSCGDRFQCANLSVPLNHLNASDPRTVSIAITKYMATKPSPSHGTLIINPGGPGGSGSQATYRLGPLLNEILEGQYDILGFDPRGVNLTLPSVKCVDPLVRFELDKILGATAPSRNSHDVGLWDSVSQLVANECEANSKSEILQFVNTPSVARDIAAIVDALHEEKKHHVSYWGFSYGTNLGAVFAGMFPNKMHKIILDGIRSPFDSREIFEWGFTSLASSTDVADGYFDICEKVGGDRCPLANSPNSNVKETVMGLFETLYERPLPVSLGNVIGLVTFLDYKTLFYETLYHPRDWQKFADITADLLNGNGTSFLVATDSWGSVISGVDSGTAVLCTDSVPATNYSLSSWKEYVHEMTETSWVSGDMRSLTTMPCRHWRSIPNERWLGDFEGVELKVPILMIGNTYDPATPIDSARRLLQKLGENAVLVEQNSYGHCSGSSVSSCTYKIILDYLLEGRLPEKGTICQVDGSFGDYFPEEKSGDLSHDLFRDLSKRIMEEIRVK
jgi:pimeloyl-ACP methyl ester carboxylesterase